MKEAGLIAHEFNAKAILEEESLIVAGLHPAHDPYEGPLDRYTRFWDPFDSFPSDRASPYSSPSCKHSSSTPSYTSAFPHGTPVIEVVTSPEESTPFQTPSEAQPLSPLPPPVEALSTSHKQPRSEETIPEGTPQSSNKVPELVFPIPILTPRLDLKTGAFNISRAVHRSNVEALAIRTMQGIGSFMVAQTSMVRRLCQCIHIVY
ncbi:hypothetical protein Salat_0261900 [Sesamum alatum]|uniref:Uncharacterized protein n=1 Tax=Sesamum alatum TaxID=300844 RepID=A0AAE1YYZ9_9LAMI|nr:hypothetical protein Salat_0261900 [Sesamum alatum]